MPNYEFLKHKDFQPKDGCRFGVETILYPIAVLIVIIIIVLVMR